MPVEATAERLRRIMVLVPWVMAQGAPTVTEVCERFGMTPEELAADIDLLLVCGLWPFTPGDYVEAFIEGDRVTISMAPALDRPPLLTRAEAMALLVAGRAVAALPGLEEAESLRSALGKLANAIAPSDAPGAEELADRIAVSLGSEGVDMLMTLRRAVEQRARLHLEYWSAGRAAMTERDIDPLLVFGAAGSWYVVAHDHDSAERRVFRVDRIKQAEPTGETFEPPEGFDPAVYEGGALFTPSSRDIDVVIDLDPAGAWMGEVVMADRVEQLDDGRQRLHLRTPHLPWLVRLLLTAGTGARPVSPPALVDAVRSAASAALAAYESP